MQNDIKPVTESNPPNLSTMPFEAALDAYAPNFKAVLPDNVSVDHFKRMVVTAVNLAPELRYADRRSLFNAAVKCASDGLLPDGREAALVVYRTKVKDRQGKERYVDQVQYLPMVAGIRKRMRNTGEVLSANAEVVYRNDEFYQERGDDPKIIHRPAPLYEERGDPVGAYAIIRLANGEVLRDVMRVSDIERSRAQSKAKNGLMWTSFWDEGAKKTVLRRCSKSAPTSSVFEKLLSRDDELEDSPAPEAMAKIPARPRREDFNNHTEESAAFLVADFAGEVHEVIDAARACDAVREAMEMGAAARGKSGIVAAWESNEAVLQELRQRGLLDDANALNSFHAEMLDQLKPSEENLMTEADTAGALSQMAK